MPVTIDFYMTLNSPWTYLGSALFAEIARRNGATIVEVNPNPTDLDDIADFRLRGPAAEILPRLLSDAF